MSRVERYVELINKRNDLIEKRCNGESWAEICNYPENRAWYLKNIAFLDFQIIKAANGIVAKLNLPCEAPKDIKEVYANPWLDKLYKEKNCVQLEIDIDAALEKAREEELTM